MQFQGSDVPFNWNSATESVISAASAVAMHSPQRSSSPRRLSSDDQCSEDALLVALHECVQEMSVTHPNVSFIHCTTIIVLVEV